LLTASLAFLALPLIVIVLAVPELLPAVLHWPVASEVHAAIAGHVNLRTVGLGVLLPDLLLTLVVAAVERRPRYLLYGLFFVAMRTIDAAIAVYTLPRAWQEKSNGRWVSPARRDPTGAAAFHPAGRLRERDAELEPVGARSGYTAEAEAGGLEAQVRLGQFLAATQDPLDLGQACVWLTKAAEAGHVEAQFSLGVLLATELDPPEFGQARVWWTRAAEAGHIKAQNNLAALLTQRLDSPDLDEARLWYTKAADAGDVRAQYGLGRLLATELDPPELAQARIWWTQAAEAGHTGSQYRLARLLADLLDPPELEQARTWYTKAANAGRAEAQFDLGVLLAERLDPPNPEEARIWYTKAAEAGHSGAKFKLGQLLAAHPARPQLTFAGASWVPANPVGRTDGRDHE
jgi:TPR repeat protein